MMRKIVCRLGKQIYKTQPEWRKKQNVLLVFMDALHVCKCE